MSEEEKEMEVAEKRQMTITPEDWVSLQTFVIDPDSKRMFEYLNKDIILSNLLEGEVQLSRDILDFITELELTKPVNIGIEKNLKKVDSGSHFWLSKVLSILHTARSRGGFQQRLFGTSVVKMERLEREKKEPWRPWMKKGGK